MKDTMMLLQYVELLENLVADLQRDYKTLLKEVIDREESKSKELDEMCKYFEYNNTSHDTTNKKEIK